MPAEQSCYVVLGLQIFFRNLISLEYHSTYLGGDDRIVDCQDSRSRLNL
jgi:hypothetical protein